jgi:hypothetical protein
MHMLLAHAFQHIRRKGPTKHYSTTIGEHGHVKFKADFQALTNGREFEGQVRSYGNFII